MFENNSLINLQVLHVEFGIVRWMLEVFSAKSFEDCGQDIYTVRVLSIAGNTLHAGLNLRSAWL